MTARLQECRLIIRSGERGTDDDIIVRVNGVRLVVRKLAGGTDSGEVMLASLYIGAVPETLLLSKDGLEPWDVDSIEFFGILSDGKVQRLKLRPEEPVTEASTINLWETPPEPPPETLVSSFEV